MCLIMTPQARYSLVVFRATSRSESQFAFSTHRLYFDDTYLFKAQAIVMEIGKDDSGDFVVLDKTIFTHKAVGSQLIRALSMDF